MKLVALHFNKLQSHNLKLLSQHRKLIAIEFSKQCKSQSMSLMCCLKPFVHSIYLAKRLVLSVFQNKGSKMEFLFILAMLISAVNGQGCALGHEQFEYSEVSDCPVLDIEDLGSTDMPSTNGLLAAALAANGSQSSVLINSFFITCFAQGAVQDSYRYLSVVVMYSQAPGDKELAVQMEVVCNQTRVWTYARADFDGHPSLTSPPDATDSNFKARKDCIICVRKNALDNLLINASHCAGIIRIIS